MNKKLISVIGIFVVVLIYGAIFIFTNNKQNNNELEIKEEILADVGTPKLINPTYPTDHYIVADYVLKPSSGDMTETIKNTLKTCGNNKGGTVWLEKGIYNVSSSITIPSGCTLMGDWQDPDNYQGTLDYGTKIVVDVKKNTVKTGLFKLKPGSGIEGLTIYYKNQNINNPISQPWSIVYIDDSSSGMSLLNTIKNITLINSYRGIGQQRSATAHAALGIENVKGTVLYEGVFLDRSGDIDTVINLTLKPKYWAKANLKAFNDNSSNYSESVISNKIKSINGRGLIITKVDAPHIVNVSISGYKYGILVPAASSNGLENFSSASIYNLNITDTQIGIKVEPGKYVDTTQLMGFVISNSNIFGTEYAIDNDCDTSKAGTFTGALKFHDVSIKGKVRGHGRNLYFNSASGSYQEVPKEIDLTNVIKNTGKFSNLNLSRKFKNKGNNFMYLNAGSSVDQINKALSTISSKGGGVVYLKPGKYTINKTVVVPANVELRGSSTSRVHYFDIGTVFDVNTTAANNFRAIRLNGNNAGITGINIIYKSMIDALGNGAYETPNFATADYAIVAEGVQNVYVYNVTIAGATFGIYFNNCNNFVAKNILSSVSHNGIRTDNSKNGLIMSTLNNGWLIGMNRLYEIKNNEGVRMNDIITRQYLEYIQLVNSSNIQLQNCYAYKSHIIVKAENSTFYGVNVGHDDSLTGGTTYVENTNSNGVIVNAVRYCHCDTVLNKSGSNVGVYNVMADWNNDVPDVKNNIFKIKETTATPTPVPKPTSKPTATPKATTKPKATSNTKALVGDVNGDNRITSTDYIVIRKYILKQANLTGTILIRADINGDGKITSIDYIVIRKMILNNKTN